MATWKQLAQMGDLEGVNVLSTTNSNEADTKYLRADGDGTCSWQTVSASVGAAQTGIESIKNTSLVVGRDDDNLIKFSTDNQIIFEVSGGDNVIFKASGEIEATSLDISGAADIDGNLSIGLNEDIDPDSSGSGQLMIDGVGYSAYVALNDSAMNIGHNSSLRDLTLQTNETTRMSIDGSGLTTITNAGDAVLKCLTESSNGDNVSAVTLTRNNNSNNVANLGVRDNEDIFRITVGSNVSASYANLGDFTRFGINANGTAVFNSSVGAGRLGANNIAVADDATISLSDNDGAITHIYVYERGSGSGAIYTVGYPSATAIILQGGGFSFANSDSDGNVCVYSSTNSHAVTFKNRTGSTRNFRIMMVGAGFASPI
jgi:hypothetical protein